MSLFFPTIRIWSSSDPVCGWFYYSVYVCEMRCISSCRGVKPYLEAICTIPDAYSFVECTQASFEEAIYNLGVINNLTLIPIVCLTILRNNPDAVQKLGESAEFQRTLLNCFRILEPLPGQLSRLLTLSSEVSSPPSSELVPLHNQFIEQVLGAASKIAYFVENKDTIKSAFALVPVEFSNFLVKTIELSADLAAAAQALLDASITGDIPFECLPSTANCYNNQVGYLLYLYVRYSEVDENEYNAAIVKILAPGTWVRPFFLGIAGSVKQWEEGKTSFEELDKCLRFSQLFLNNKVTHRPTEEKWERRSKSAALLASPAFQAEAKEYLNHYLACVANAFPPLEADDFIGVHSRILHIFAYTAMAEATALTAQANAAVPNWKQLASNIIDLGNAWMGLNASEAFAYPFLKERKWAWYRCG